MAARTFNLNCIGVQYLKRVPGFYMMVMHLTEHIAFKLLYMQSSLFSQIYYFILSQIKPIFEQINLEGKENPILLFF